MTTLTLTALAEAMIVIDDVTYVRIKILRATRRYIEVSGLSAIHAGKTAVLHCEGLRFTVFTSSPLMLGYIPANDQEHADKALFINNYATN